MIGLDVQIMFFLSSENKTVPEGTEHTVRVEHPRSSAAIQEKKILVPKGLTECEPVIKITEKSRNHFEKLAQVLQNVQQDKQVLIVLDKLQPAQMKQFKEKMPKDKFLVYLSYDPTEEMPNDDISEIKGWLTEEPSEKKFLLCDQYNAGGYEFASVILVTKYLQDTRTSNMCQRAKAKLIVYEIPRY